MKMPEEETDLHDLAGAIKAQMEQELPSEWGQMQINDWQRKTFGLEDKDPFAIWDKFQGEVAELYSAMRQYQQVRELHGSSELEKFCKELADVYIVLCQLAGQAGINIQGWVDVKMDVNVNRQWNVTADGIGQHVEGTGS